VKWFFAANLILVVVGAVLFLGQTSSDSLAVPMTVASAWGGVLFSLLGYAVCEINESARRQEKHLESLEKIWYEVRAARHEQKQPATPPRPVPVDEPAAAEPPVIQPRSAAARARRLR